MQRRKAFTLLEVSVSLVLMGLVAGILLQFRHGDATDCNATTKSQMKQIEHAMHDYVIAHDRFPIPAVRTAGVEDPQYGREAPIASLDNAGGVLFGALPFQELNLSPSFAGDCWGNKFTYAVTADLTDKTKFLVTTAPTYDGTITLKSSAATTLNSNIAYAVISHGADGVGAVKVNYSDASNTVRKWCSTGSAIENVNCSAASPTVMAAAYNDGKDASTNLFDDLVLFGGKEQRVVDGSCNNAVPLGCTAGSASNDNGLTSCSTTRTWHCDGANGGTNDTSCTHAYPACINCSSTSLTWGIGCSGTFPATIHLATSAPATANTNPSFTPASSATAVCNNGTFNTPIGTCVALPPVVNGVCNNAVPLGCTAGTATVDNGLTACSTTHSWVCAGSGGGTNSAPCSFANAACLNCTVQSASWGAGCSANFPAAAHGSSTVPITNTNPAYTGTGTGTCTNGVLTVTGTCTPLVPVNGACDNTGTVPACAAGTLDAASLTNNGVCGTTSAWTCKGSGGGTDDTSCTAANPTCGVCGGTYTGPMICNGASNDITCGAGEKLICTDHMGNCPGPQSWKTCTCTPDASCSTACSALGLNEGEGNMIGGPGCQLTSCCSGTIVTTYPTLCPTAGYIAGGGNCTPTCPPVTNGTTGPAPVCTITCDTGYMLSGSSCVPNACLSGDDGWCDKFFCHIRCYGICTDCPNSYGYAINLMPGTGCDGSLCPTPTCPAVANGTTSANPPCTITCNAGYTLSGSACVPISVYTWVNQAMGVCNSTIPPYVLCSSSSPGGTSCPTSGQMCKVNHLDGSCGGVGKADIYRCQ